MENYTEPAPEDPSIGGTQGDLLAVWGLWGLLLAAMAVTYARIDTAELYNVSRSGLGGAGSRLLVQLNYPIALIAIAAVLIALDTLGGRWWWLAAPTIAACALAAWPGVVDDGDLDARWINTIPAMGVAAALALSILAAKRSTTSMAPRRRFDPARLVIAAVVLVLSLPWLAADLGVYFAEGGFITERAITGSDGIVNPAVHLGHHHGLDGAFILLSALLLSRPRLRSPRLRAITTGYVALMAAYGAVNAAQDFWHEQVQKRGWSSWTFPKAVEPSLTFIWLMILVTTLGVLVLLRQESGPTRRGLSDRPE